MARLSYPQTPSSQTSRHFDQPGGLPVQTENENSSPGVSNEVLKRNQSAFEHEVPVRVM